MHCIHLTRETEIIHKNFTYTCIGHRSFETTASEITYIVSSGALNSTHSLTPLKRNEQCLKVKSITSRFCTDVM